MNKRLLLLLPFCLLLAGCATTKRVTDLETRIGALENSVSPDMKSESAVVTTGMQQERYVPETPGKKDIQNALKNAGYYDGAVDGKIGSKTRSAIEEFQRANDLKADGKVGKKTWNKLKEYLR
jgi:peptidoglycan hydrolase-like protein with peptidoglycan-binding domain